MKNEQILKLLNENKIEELKEKLSQEIALEDIKAPNSKSNYKAVYNYLKKQKSRPILHYCIYKNDMQEFTNTYFATRLVKEDYNPLIPSFEETNGNYEKIFPNIDAIIDSSFHDYDSRIIELTFNELMEIINELKAKQLKSTDDKSYFKRVNKWYDYKLLDIAFKSLNPKQHEKYRIRYNEEKPLNPIVIIKENGSHSIVCPCRPPKQEY